MHNLQIASEHASTRLESREFRSSEWTTIFSWTKAKSRENRTKRYHGHIYFWHITNYPFLCLSAISNQNSGERRNWSRCYTELTKWACNNCTRVAPTPRKSLGLAKIRKLLLHWAALAKWREGRRQCRYLKSSSHDQTSVSQMLGSGNWVIHDRAAAIEECVINSTVVIKCCTFWLIFCDSPVHPLEF